MKGKKKIARTMPKPRPFQFLHDTNVRINHSRVTSMLKIIFKDFSIVKSLFNFDCKNYLSNEYERQNMDI